MSRAIMSQDKAGTPLDEDSGENSLNEAGLYPENNSDKELMLLLSRSPSLSKTISENAHLFHKIIQEVMEEKLNEKVSAEVEKVFLKRGLLYRTGKTAGQIWSDLGFPSLKNASQWVSKKLVEANCQIQNHHAELGDTTARLFDPDKVSVWLTSGGKAELDMYFQERIGQGRLNFA